MRAVFGVVSLLVVLAIVGFVGARQLRAVKAPFAAAPAGSAPVAGGTVRAQAANLEKQIATDVTKALEQGAASRREDAEK